MKIVAIIEVPEDILDAAGKMTLTRNEFTALLQPTVDELVKETIYYRADILPAWRTLHHITNTYEWSDMVDEIVLILEDKDAG